MTINRVGYAHWDMGIINTIVPVPNVHPIVRPVSSSKTQHRHRQCMYRNVKTVHLAIT